MKHIRLTVNKQKLIEHNITIFSGYYRLTPTEQKILASIITYYIELKKKILDEALFNSNFMDANHKSKLIEEFKFSAPMLTKYLNQLKSKKVLKEENGTYSIDSKFLPADKVLFEFKIVE